MQGSPSNVITPDKPAFEMWDSRHGAGQTMLRQQP